MSRLLAAGSRLVVATHNAGKLREIDAMLAPFGIDAVSAGALGLPEPDETEDSFAGNAQLKALAAAMASGCAALADDSGVCVAALGGAPGIYSARWAGPAKDFDAAMRRVREEIGDNPDHRMWFISALCVAWPDGHVETFEGRVDGTLAWPPRGGQGFGYDPIFVPDGSSLTYGETDPAEKHAASHRAKAFALFKAACLDGAAPLDR